jgi:hypothetical protein
MISFPRTPKSLDDTLGSQGSTARFHHREAKVLDLGEKDTKFV